MNIGGLDLLLRETDMREQVEARLLDFLGRNLQRAGEEIGAECPFVEDEADVESGGERAIDLGERGGVKALGAESRMIDARRLAERGMADGVSLDLGDMRFVIAERAQSFGRGAVDDFEIAAARQLLELHQSEIGLDAGRVAIHHEADRAGRRDNRDLRIAIAVLFALRQRLAPDAARRLRQAGPGDARLFDRGMIERRRRHRQRFIAGGMALGGARVVSHHAQHWRGIGLMAGESAKLGGHFGRGGIGAPRHDRRQRAADRARFVAVIGDAARHQQPADIGEAEAERAIIIGIARDFLGGKLRHRHRDFEDQRPQPHGVFV